MARTTRKNSGPLFSAAAWGAMAVTIAGLVAPTAAAAADRQNERRENSAFEQRAEQARARANERASARAWRGEARPPAAERAQTQMRGRWSRGDGDAPRAEPNRPRVQTWTPGRAPAESRNDDRRDHDRSWSGTRTWSQNREGTAWRQDRRDDDRQDRRDSYRNDRRDNDGRDNWRNRRDNDGRDNWRNRTDNDGRDSWRNDRRGDWRNDAYRYRDRDRSAWRDRDDRRWDRHSWRRDNRYDWQSYRDRHRSIYRIGRYYAPYRSYYYRRIVIGFWLDPLFYGPRYWIDDPWYYRLPPVYGPYRWVRYYDDALLVNIYTGEVVDVIYDFFW